MTSPVVVVEAAAVVVRDAFSASTIPATATIRHEWL